MAFALTSTTRLIGGHQIPLLGLGVYQNYDARTSALQALEAGYRHIDSAQAYRNEEAVGQGVAESSVKREDIFVSKRYPMRSFQQRLPMELTMTPHHLGLCFLTSEQGQGEKSRIPVNFEIRRREPQEFWVW